MCFCSIFFIATTQTIPLINAGEIQGYSFFAKNKKLFKYAIKCYQTVFKQEC